MRRPGLHDLGSGAGPRSTADVNDRRFRAEPEASPSARAQEKIGQAAVELVLAEQNRRFDAALSNMPHGLCMFDGETRLILCNPAYRRLYALPEHLARPGTPLQDILDHRVATGSGPLDWTDYRDIVVESALRGGDLVNRHIQLQDGRTIQITHNPIPDGGYVASHEDVTEILAAAAEPATTPSPACPTASCCTSGSTGRSPARGRVIRWRCCASTSIISRRSTIPWAIRSATICCAP